MHETCYQKLLSTIWQQVEWINVIIHNSDTKLYSWDIISRINKMWQLNKLHLQYKSYDKQDMFLLKLMVCV